jgi:hypothetical protein
MQDDRRMKVWISMVDSIPYLSSPASGIRSGVAFGAHTTRSLYPSTDMGPRIRPSVSTGR